MAVAAAAEGDTQLLHFHHVRCHVDQTRRNCYFRPGRFMAAHLNVAEFSPTTLHAGHEGGGSCLLGIEFNFTLAFSTPFLHKCFEVFTFSPLLLVRAGTHPGDETCKTVFYLSKTLYLHFIFMACSVCLVTCAIFPPTESYLLLRGA